jgi:phosphoglycerate dehydrogenase-like enzyme
MIDICIAEPVHEPALHRLRQFPDLRVHIINSGEEDVWAIPEPIVGSTKILFASTPPTNLADAKNLRLLQIASAGYSQLFGLGLETRGVHVCNAAGVFDVPIAEWNIAMIVNLSRDLRAMIRNQDAGRWDRDSRFQHEVSGSTVGLWGYGGIARETARLCKAMGLHIHVLARQKPAPRLNQFVVKGRGDAEAILPDRVFLETEKAEFLAGLDFLIVAMPLTKRTQGLIGEVDLRMLPATAFVLNPARGPIIQEAALLKALREKWIAGAALDTHYYYPMPPEHPLWSMPNVIMTPHISGSSQTQTFAQRIWDIFLANVDRLVFNQPLLNELSTHQLQGY